MSEIHYDGAIINKWCLEEFDGDNIIYPWGVETADSDGFFSLDRSAGYRYQIIKEIASSSGEGGSSFTEVKMRDGHWSLNTEDRTLHHGVNRKISFTAIEESWQMDFVMRFRFAKKYFEKAMINGKEIVHRNSNIYYQFPVRQAQLISANGFIDIRLIDYATNSSFAPEMYVRDRGDEWIVHVRMMPQAPGREIIKMCNRYMMTKSLPQWLSSLILSFSTIRSQLWYRGEKKPFRSFLGRNLNPNAFRLGKVRKGESLSMEVECVWNSREA